MRSIGAANMATMGSENNYHVCCDYWVSRDSTLSLPAYFVGMCLTLNCHAPYVSVGVYVRLGG
jgi:hypothetical protein